MADINLLAEADKVEAAALVLSLPEWWTQGNFAVNRRGIGLVSDHKAACAFCLLGAIGEAGAGRSTTEHIAAMLHHRGLHISLSQWNDSFSRTNTEVASFLFDCADELRARATTGASS